MNAPITRLRLDYIINQVDYTTHQCSVTAMVGAALEESALKDAREALDAEPADSPERSALLLLLDQIDFTHHACSPFEMVGAVLPKTVIAKVREVLK